LKERLSRGEIDKRGRVRVLTCGEMWIAAGEKKDAGIEREMVKFI